MTNSSNGSGSVAKRFRKYKKNLPDEELDGKDGLSWLKKIQKPFRS